MVHVFHEGNESNTDDSAIRTDVRIMIHWHNRVTHCPTSIAYLGETVILHDGH